ncbi:MAG: iron ABC transporter permease [Candidatus Thiosymbion ectosymbiont of Robbea hypermnestra]|nr:iron ABC transporter permease [Candidatus Thiosymbion ectosymbiont of Robbea hypermnestra]
MQYKVKRGAEGFLGILGMGLVLLAVAGASLLTGAVEVTPAQALALLTGGDAPEQARLILLEIRLPRIALAALAGYALALGGVVFQAVLRNPLADPFILGVSSGSAFGALLGIALGLGFGFGVPALSFVGALVTILLLLALGLRTIGSESSTILLTGVIINSFFTATIMFLLSITTDARLHAMLFWLYGDLSQTNHDQLALVALVLLPASLILYGFTRHLNLLTAGEDTAMRLGMDVVRTKLVLLILVSLMIGAVVAFSGVIGFVGLIVPHLVRMVCGPDHRRLIPLAALGGAAFLVAADTLARTLIAPSELPVGVISAFLGAPFFIFLLRIKGSQWNRS